MIFFLMAGKLIRAFQVMQNPPTLMQGVQETQVQFLGREIPQRRKWQPAPLFLPGELDG